MVDLRAYVFLDSLQPQFASFQATISKGYLPKVGQASLFVEIAPGMAINQILDVALKSTDVTAGMQIVERHYGMLELHSESQADVRQAGQAILDYLDLKERTVTNRGWSRTRWFATSKIRRPCSSTAFDMAT
jgi:hypothetical protein